MANLYVVFPTLGNEELCKAIYNRAIELGYKSIATRTQCELDSVILSTGGEILHSGHPTNDKKLINGGHVYGHELGDFWKLMFTDHYRIKKPIQVKLNDEYTAEVSNNGVKVGCKTFPFDKVDELIKAVQEWRK